MVTAGYAIYDMMQAVSSPVYTYCIGICAAEYGFYPVKSGGVGSGNRYIYPTAEVMIHQRQVGSRAILPT